MDMYSKTFEWIKFNTALSKQIESQNCFGLNQTAEIQINLGITFSLKSQSCGSKELVKKRL